MASSPSKGLLSNFEEISATDTEDVNKLKELDDFLKCPICYEYFDTCVVTQCSHNFCSLCIRKYTQFKNECPVCFVEMYDSQLRTNRIIDTFVSILPNLKDRLIRRIRTLKTLKPDMIYVSPSKSTDDTPVFRRSAKKRKLLTEKGNETIKEEPLAACLDPDGSGSSLSSNNVPTVVIPPIFQSPVKKNVSTTPRRTVDKVQCPICSIDIPEKNINTHLDKCLERQEHSQKKKNTDKSVTRPHLPKLVPALMSTTSLKNKAKEYGLSSHGDNETLKNRIQRFTLLYNSECDKEKPRPVPEIIQQLEKEEKALSQMLPKSIFSVPYNKTPTAELNTIYLEKNKTSFDQLITGLRSRKSFKNNPNCQSAADINFVEPDHSKPSTSRGASGISTHCYQENGIDIEEIKIEPSTDYETNTERSGSNDVKSEGAFVSVDIKEESDDAVFDALTDEDNDGDVENSKSSDSSIDLNESPVFHRRSSRKLRKEGESTEARKSLRKRKR